MPIFLEMPNLDANYKFRFLKNDGDILTTPHWHKEYELLLVTRDKVSLGINDKQYQLHQGDIAFFDSGNIHYVVATPNSQRYVYQFDLDFFNDVLRKNPNLQIKNVLSSVAQLSFDWPLAVQNQIRTLLLQIAKEYQNKVFGYELAVEGLLYQLLIIMLRQLPKQQSQSTELSDIKSTRILATLNRVFTFVEANYTHDIALEDVAATANFSQYYFTRFFKQNIGKTFLEFLNDYRIDKAKWILINTDLSITEILYKVGFNSDKTFYRLFKQRMGMTPKQYRNMYQINK